MKKKILLVDDDGLITQTYTYILKQNGYEAESLNSLKEIKSLINEWTPDIIILDVKIGNKNLAIFAVLKKKSRVIKFSLYPSLVRNHSCGFGSSLFM